MKTTHRTFVSYIDRTRGYYAAQGYDEPYAWARHTDAPFAPLPRALAHCRVGVVTTASPWQEQKSVDGVLRGAKQVYSLPADPPPERLYTDDLAWDRISEIATASRGADPFGYRSEFLSLVRLAAAIDKR